MANKKRITKFIKVFKQYKAYPKAVKESLLDDPEFVKTIGDCCLNVMFNSKLNIKSQDKNKLSKHKRLIKMLSNKKIKLHKKRKLLKLKGGSLIPLIFSILSPIFGSLINKLIPQ